MNLIEVIYRKWIEAVTLFLSFGPCVGRLCLVSIALLRGLPNLISILVVKVVRYLFWLRHHSSTALLLLISLLELTSSSAAAALEESGLYSGSACMLSRYRDTAIIECDTGSASLTISPGMAAEMSLPSFSGDDYRRYMLRIFDQNTSRSKIEEIVGRAGRCCTTLSS